MKKYVLITSLKDEEDCLPILAKSVIEQTILPEIWLIVDESIDRTPAIINDLQKDYPWIRSLTRERTNEYGWKNFSKAIKEGFDRARTICEDENIEYSYVGKVDADTILSDNYFEVLMTKFDQDSALGIAGGREYLLPDAESIGKVTLQKKNYVSPDHVSDTGRLYRRECLNEIGDIPIVNQAQDTIMLVKARLNGWKTQHFEDTQYYLYRETSSKEGRVKGMKIDAYKIYYLDYNRILIFAMILRNLIKDPYRSYITLTQYISYVVRREPKINDNEIRYYFRHIRIKEILNNILVYNLK